MEEIKEKLLQADDEFHQPFDIEVEEFQFKVAGLSGIRLFHVEKTVAKLAPGLTTVQDGEEVLTVPEEIRYLACLLSQLVLEPKLSPIEWVLVFNRRPRVFLPLANKIAQRYFGAPELTPFLLDELSKIDGAAE